MNKSNMRCDNCKYWRPTWEYDVLLPEEEGQKRRQGWLRELSHKDEWLGKCHRYPPVLDPVFTATLEENSDEGCESNPGSWEHPITIGKDFCGEGEFRGP